MNHCLSIYCSAMHIQPSATHIYYVFLPPELKFPSCHLWWQGKQIQIYGPLWAGRDQHPRTMILVVPQTGVKGPVASSLRSLLRCKNDETEIRTTTLDK